MNEQTPENTPKNTPSRIPFNFNLRQPLPMGRLLILGIALVLIVGIAWTYLLGYVSFATQGQTATTTSQSETATVGSVAWKLISTQAPFKHISVSNETDYPGDTASASYDFYDAGTFVSGPLSGNDLVLGVEKYIASEGPDSGTSYLSQYVYFVMNASSTPIGWWQDPTVHYPTELGLANVHKLDDSEFPAKLLTYRQGYTSLVRETPDGPITMQSGITFPTTSLKLQPVPGFQFDGDPILRAPASTQSGVFSGIQPYNYYIQLPTGLLFGAILTPGFISAESSVPQLTWTTGSTTVAAYNYDQYAYGISDCYASLKNFDTLKAAFVQTGATTKGDPVYEVNPAGHDAVYKCLYAKTQRYNYDPTTKKSTSYYPSTYTDFLGSHPVFFWKNATNDWVIFGRTDVVPAAEKAKPVIYLYPTKTEQVSVKVDPIGGFTKTEPAYGNGWNVLATPDSVLTNLTDGKTYPYLFWEGGAKGVVNTPKEGFVVARAGIPALLSDKLALLGLNAKERADFMSFWVPRLSKAPYYFITFVPKSEMDRVAPLTIVPTPDSVIRVLMDYKPLSALRFVEPLEITTPVRTGFTTVEWGGIIRD